MSETTTGWLMTDPHIATDPPIDLRAHPRPIGSDVFKRRCPAVFVATTNQTERKKPKPVKRHPPTGKICRACRTWKPFTEYYPSSLQSGSHRLECISCNNTLRNAARHGETLLVRGRLAARRAAERERGQM